MGAQHTITPITIITVVIVTPIPPQDGWTPLHWATRGGHYDAVEMLLDVGANVNAQINVCVCVCARAL